MESSQRLRASLRGTSHTAQWASSWRTRGSSEAAAPGPSITAASALRKAAREAAAQAAEYHTCCGGGRWLVVVVVVGNQRSDMLELTAVSCHRDSVTWPLPSIL